MKVFIIKAIVFSFIVLSIFALVVSRHRHSLDVRNDYMASIIDRHGRLEQAGNNRLLLVGGSNLTFGINSETMQEQMGLNVVNLGMHAGLGGVFILSEASSVVKAGDTVVVCLEYDIFGGDRQIDLIEHTQLIYPPAKAYYSFSLKEQFLLYYKHFKKVTSFDDVGSGTSQQYSRQVFNVYGDVVIRVDKMNNTLKLSDANKMDVVVLDSSIVQAFHDLSARCDTVGARLYLAYPVYPKSLYQRDKSVIGDVESQIRSKLDFIPTISDPDAFVMDDSYFHDTGYHLNETGRKLRTAILIDKLKDALRRN